MAQSFKLPSGTTSLGGYTPKIVIVDDDEAHLQFIRLIMAREEYKTELQLFPSPEEGFAYLVENEADLILLDVMMPGMSGFELLEKLRANPSTKDTPVIFLTSTQDTEHVVRAFEAGAVDYIAKPINSAILTARIGGVLQRKYLENELRLHNRELERLNRFKDELVSVISHDLRSPMAAIEVICQNWKNQTFQGKEDQNESNRIDRIINQSRLARRLVDNFLDYDKMEHGRLVPEPSFFPLNELIVGCAEDEQPLLQARELELELDVPEEVLLVFGDREMMAQAVRNVLGNAIKFAKHTISLRASCEGLSQEQGGTLTVSITDDGPGIPPEKLATIFEKYSKADPNLSGTGLGLYITREVLSIHQGNVSVSSEPGKETTFLLQVPLVYRPEDLPDLGDLAEEPVVIVSSSKTTAALLEGILSEAGLIGVTTVVSERPELEEIQVNGPKLVVLDAPQDSLQLTHLAKLLPMRQQAIWLVHGEQKASKELMETTGDDLPFLASPVDPLRFLQLVASLLRGQIPEGATLFG